MTHFIEGLDRPQTMLLSEHLDDYIDENSHGSAWLSSWADAADVTLRRSAKYASSSSPYAATWTYGNNGAHVVYCWL